MLPENCVCGNPYEPVPQQKDDGTWRVYCAKCGEDLIPPMVGHLKIVSFINRGGFADVYLAVVDHWPDAFAVKFLSPKYLTNEEVRRRFQREVHAVRQLRHRNICAVLTHSKHHETPYIVMEYISGETIRTRLLLMQGPPNIKQWLDIAIQVAEGLSEAHKRGVIHRDIKPENVMITLRGEVVKILDFGLARLEVPFNRILDSSVGTDWLTESGERLGTKEYMSPEQIMAEPRVGEVSDIFSFGILLYEMFSGGTHPFLRKTRDATLIAIVKEKPIPLRKLNPAVPRKLQCIIQKALRKNKRRRYRTESLLKDLVKVRSRLQ